MTTAELELPHGHRAGMEESEAPGMSLFCT